ncbi:hypothetical protein [Nocardia sp. NPDC059154]
MAIQWSITVNVVGTRDHHDNPDTVYRLRLKEITAERGNFRFTVTVAR